MIRYFHRYGSLTETDIELCIKGDHFPQSSHSFNTHPSQHTPTIFMDSSRPKLILRLTRVRQNDENDGIPRYTSSLSETSLSATMIPGTNIPNLLPPPHMRTSATGITPEQEPLSEISVSDNSGHQTKRRKHNNNANDAVVPCQDALETLAQLENNALFKK